MQLKHHGLLDEFWEVVQVAEGRRWLQEDQSPLRLPEIYGNLALARAVNEISEDCAHDNR